MQGQEKTYIPGDEVSVEIGSIMHEMNITNVASLFEHEGGGEGIVLNGWPERSEDSHQYEDAVGLKRSRAIIKATIPEDATPGLYRCAGLMVETYAEREIAFAPGTEEIWSEWSFRVGEEPTTPPKFHLNT